MALTPEVEEIVERAAARMKSDWDDQLARLLVDWEPITMSQSQELQSQVRTIVDANDPEALSELTVSESKATDLLGDYLVAMFMVGEDQIRQEAREQGVVIENRHGRAWALNELDPDVISLLIQIASVIVHALASGLTSAIMKLVLRLWGTQPDGDSMATEVREFIAGLSDRALRDELGGGLTNAMNRGRFSQLLTANAATWYATERNDPSRCKPCGDIDETQFATLAAAMAAYPTGGYRDCEGGVRCRGGVVPVWEPS